MWTCIHCGLSVMFRAVSPEIDEEGIYFICQGCEGRNPLINVSTDPEFVDLAQPR